MCSGCEPGRRPRFCARGAAYERPFSLLPLLAGLDLLLTGDRALRTAAAARIGAGALSAHWKAAAVTAASVRADLGHALDVRGHLAPEVSFDEDFLRRGHAVDDLAQASDLLLAEVLHPGVGVEVGGLDDLLRGGAADPMDVHERNDHALLRGYVDTGDSRHLALYPCLCLCFGFLEQITRTTPGLLIALQFGHIFLTDGRTFISKSLEFALAIDRGSRARPPPCLPRGAA